MPHLCETERVASAYDNPLCGHDGQCRIGFAVYRTDTDAEFREASLYIFQVGIVGESHCGVRDEHHFVDALEKIAELFFRIIEVSLAGIGLNC